MAFYTPLRYPGGKRRLAFAVKQLIDENNLTDVHYVEPYAGGAAVALSLLFEEYAADIHINDLSRPVFAFWHTALNETKEFCRRIRGTRISMSEWHRQREVYEKRETEDLFNLGFSTLFLNRSNRSGIVSGGVIGGKSQKGPWTIRARFNKDELVRRIERIGRYRSRINIHSSEAMIFSERILPALGTKSFLFFDPPYIDKSESLYLNRYDIDDHREISQRIAMLGRPWVVTYDDAAVRECLYPNHRRLAYRLSYSAQDRYKGKEVMFLSDDIQIPSSWRRTGAAIPLAPASSRFQFYGKMLNMKPHAPKKSDDDTPSRRFESAVKTVLSVPKASVPNPFKKPRTKPKRNKKS